MLFVLTVGCLLFWPSGVKQSFGGFCGSMFVVGAGLSTLKTGADNFLSICGPPRYSEIRLNVAQGVQGIGSFVAPLLAARVFFAKTVDTKQGLKNVQWVYLGMACFVALLIIVFWLAPMPEVTDADMHAQEGEIEQRDVGPFWKQTNLFLGVWSQFCYVCAQVAVAKYVNSDSRDLRQILTFLKLFHQFRRSGWLLRVNVVEPACCWIRFVCPQPFTRRSLHFSSRDQAALPTRDIFRTLFCFRSRCHAVPWPGFSSNAHSTPLLRIRE